MATFAFTDAFLLLNAVNMSAMAKKATLKIDVAELDDTAFGDTYHSRLGGLKDYSLDIEWNEDFAAAQVDALIFPLLGTVISMEVRPTSGIRSPTNPAYLGTILVKDYQPANGAVGDLASVTTSWPGASTLTRATA